MDRDGIDVQVVCTVPVMFGCVERMIGPHHYCRVQLQRCTVLFENVATAVSLHGHALDRATSCTNFFENGRVS
jgi:hypothetical protein